MKVAKNDNLICFDTDDTLVTFKKIEGIEPIFIGSGEFKQAVYPISEHVQAIKNSKTRGHYVVVWSQGGHEWAQQVVEALGLTEFVDLVMSKPAWIYDDLDPSEWMPKPFYYGKREPEEK